MNTEQDVNLNKEIPCDNNDLRALIEKSIKLSEEVYEQNKKINKRLRNMVWGSYLRLALIIIPIIIGIIYLPAYFSQIMKQYQGVLDLDSVLSAEQITNFSSSNQIKGIIDLLNNNK